MNPSFWFDRVLVHKWLPEGSRGKWSIRRIVIEGSRWEWLRMGGDPYGNQLPPGTYTGLFRKSDDSDGEQRVMFDEIAEIKEAERFVAQAHGNVLVTGLGLGMIATWLASKPSVTRVDVVEIDADVIALVAPYLPSSKIRIIHADAYNFRPTENYQSIWHDCFLAEPLNVEELKAHYPCERQDHWQPGVQTAPIPRRSFMGGMIAVGVMLMALRTRAAAAMPAITGPVQEVVLGSTGTSQNVEITIPVAGNSLIASIGSGLQINSMSGGGVTWVAAVQKNQNSTEFHAIWYGHNSDGTGDEISVVIGGRFGTSIATHIAEWSGLNDAVPDTTNSLGNDSSTTPSAGDVTTTNANSLIVSGAVFIDNNYSSGPINGFTRRTSINAGAFFLENASKNETTLGTYSTAWTLTAATGWASTIAAFGAPAPSGPTNAQRSAGFFMADNH